MDDLELSLSGREAIADWIEASLLVRGARQLGVDNLHEIAASEAKVGFAQTNLAVDTMRRRSALLGSAYPFQVVGDLAVRGRADAVTSPYAALVLLTPGSVARRTLVGGSTDHEEVLFERITEEALTNLWGNASRAIRFGYPSEHHRPQQFGEAIDWLAKQMGISPGTGYRPPRRKDGGVDVVAWRPFPDGRSGFPVVLVQCTLQSELFSKSGDVDVRIWSTWLALDFEPQTALAVPGVIGSSVEWSQIAVRSMILDRIRLTHLLPGVAHEGVVSWVTDIVDGLRPMMAAGQA